MNTFCAKRSGTKKNKKRERGRRQIRVTVLSCKAGALMCEKSSAVACQLGNGENKQHRRFDNCDDATSACLCRSADVQIAFFSPVYI